MQMLIFLGASQMCKLYQTQVINMSLHTPLEKPSGTQRSGAFAERLVELQSQDMGLQLYAVSSYPSPDKDVNIRRMNKCF